MSDKQWIGLPSTTVLSTRSQLISTDKVTTYRPGCFQFGDGTTQGWTIDQLYNAEPPYQLTASYPAPGKAAGFTLKNSQNLALAAETAILVVPDVKVRMCQFFLDSPNLLGNGDWEKSAGYGLDLYRTFTSSLGEPKPLNEWYTAQLQVVCLDVRNNTLHTFGEWDPVKKTFLFHVISLAKPYHIEWKFSRKRHYRVAKVRVRLSMPTYNGPGMGEFAPRGSWLVGNVCPVN